ncbi:hypothetical protein VY88_10085 [Azospirillum thiophilum]|uniref:AAA+ ATPase domain-containing protein n=1 Tax=Azospirillum thiophilum TaxID=528244 RepID=A0AAC8ZT64_9PROT|nr:MoxR family ATPase [Azospirillum thiophilum]ALG69998.1 hypothetical protein AL072_02625 [Azospirillum thiophilum]KJR66317.1 hypothetical protein VY88_10085 [Azospirillum thiophilum]
MNDWKIFRGDGVTHDGLIDLPDPPPWRFGGQAKGIEPVAPGACSFDPLAEAPRARAFLPTQEMILAVNAALYLRRPLLLTGRPGSGKSTLISKVAHELMMGPVLRWPINSRSTVRGGVYEYDAIGRLQADREAPPPVEQYLTLGPLGTALAAKRRPRALLIDEIDKSDLDFANDLLNVIEEGDYEIPELRRLGEGLVKVRNASGNEVSVTGGRLTATQFPFVVMTSNGEREFPAPFLRRCIRLTIEPPERERLGKIIEAQLERYRAALAPDAVEALIDRFLENHEEGKMATDQLLNAVFLTVALRGGEGRSFSDQELEDLRESLLRPLDGADV